MPQKRQKLEKSADLQNFLIEINTFDKNLVTLKRAYQDLEKAKEFYAPYILLLRDIGNNAEIKTFHPKILYLIEELKKQFYQLALTLQGIV
jgi:hypothetical protein